MRVGAQDVAAHPVGKLTLGVEDQRDGRPVFMKASAELRDGEQEALVGRLVGDGDRAAVPGHAAFLVPEMPGGVFGQEIKQGQQLVLPVSGPHPVQQRVQPIDQLPVLGVDVGEPGAHGGFVVSDHIVSTAASRCPAQRPRRGNEYRVRWPAT